MTTADVGLATMRVRASDGTSLVVGAHPGGGDGPVVLVLHGLFSHMGWYRALADDLCSEGAAVYLLDRRGAGRSEGIRGHMASWRLVVDDVLRIAHEVRAVHPGRALHAIGISLGGTISMAAAMLHPELFASLVLLSPGLAARFKLPLHRRLRLLQTSVLNPTKPYDLPFTDELLTDRPAWRKVLWEDPLRTRTVTARFLVETFRMQGFVRRHMDLLRVPLFALVAEQDLLVDNDVTIAALRRAASAHVRLEIFEGASHVLPACVPGVELTSRFWRWFAPRPAPETERLSVHRVPSFAAAALAANLPPTLCDPRS